MEFVQGKIGHLKHVDEKEDNGEELGGLMLPPFEVEGIQKRGEEHR